jgi:carbon starvation protein
VARNRIVSTLLTLILPTGMAFMTYTTAAGQQIPVWRAIWPVFGATNQLLAGLSLLAVTVWLKRTGRSYLFAGIPMVFMVVMTLTATLMLVVSASSATLVRTIGAVLFVLGLMMVVEAFRALGKPTVPREAVRVKGGVPAPAEAAGD